MNPMNALINKSTIKSIREEGRKIATLKDQPTAAELKGQNLYAIPRGTPKGKACKPLLYGKITGVYLTSGIFGDLPGLAPHYQCAVDTDDSMFALHQITKVGTKFVWDGRTARPTKKDIVMIELPGTKTTTTVKTKPVKKAVTMKAATTKAPAKKVAVKPAAKKVAVKPAAKKVAPKVAAKPARTKKPVVRVPRKPRMTNAQLEQAALKKFEASKLVSGLISTYMTEQGEKIVTHVDQPEVKAILNRDVFVRDAHTQKLVKLGRVESAMAAVSTYDLGLFYVYTVWVDDGALNLHQIRKVGTKFVYDASLPMPNKRQTVLVDQVNFDKPRSKKATVEPTAKVKRQPESRDNTLILEIADKATLKLTKVEGELSGAAIAKGTAVIIDPSIRGDVIKSTKIIIEGKGTKRSPFVKRRFILTEKGQKCAVADLKLNRGKLRAV